MQDNDFVSRAAIIREIERIRKSTKTLTGIDFLRMIETFPAVDAAPVVHGRWIEDKYSYIHCGVCGTEWDALVHPETNYCPNCGAKMDGGLDDATD